MAEPRSASDLPPMVPDREDIRPSRPMGGNGGPPPKSPRSAKPRSGGGSGGSLGSIVMFLVLLIAIAGLGLLTYSQSQMLASYEERLELADERIVSLEQSMTETDESVVMNESAINAQFRSIKAETDLHMSEIRKLWDVSNKRNRGWIEENQEAIGQLQSNDQAIGERLDTVAASVSSQSQRLEELDGTINSTRQNLQQSLADVQQSMAELSESMSGADTSTLERRLAELAVAQENLQFDIGDISTTQLVLRETLEEVNETIRSIDASRLDTNRRMVALSDRLQELEQRVGTNF